MLDVENLSLLEVLKMNQQTSIPGIVRDGVVVPQSNERLPEGTHVEIRLEPGDVPAGLKSEVGEIRSELGKLLGS